MKFYSNHIRMLCSIVVLALSYLVIVDEWLSPSVAVWVLTGLFLLWIAIEYRSTDHLFFALPPAYFSVYMFINIFLGSIFYYSFDSRAVTQFQVMDRYIVLGVWYTLCSVQILWIAFHAVPSVSYNFFRRFEIKNLPVMIVHLLVVVFFLSFFVGITTGTFGYVADSQRVEFLAFVRLGLSGGLVAISLLTIYYYQGIRYRMYLYAVVASNMFVGLLFGSKSSVVMPLVVLLLTHYCCRRGVSWFAFLGIIAALGVSFQAIEPFREYFDAAGRSGDIGIGSLIQMFASAQDYAGVGVRAHVENFIDRMNYVTPLGMTIEYADVSGYYHSEEWRNLALSPLYGLVPRFIWESKPLADFGLWASVNIFNLPATTHTGITPQGYSYLVLRLPGVLLFFALYGVIQKIAFNMFYFREGLLPVYIFFYFNVIYPSYPVWTAVSSFVQNTAVAIIFLAIVRFFGTRRGH